LSKNYNEKTKDFELFIGSIHENTIFEQYIIPKGKYAKTIIKPKFGFMWGFSIGEAKRYFYTKWLKNNEYKPLGQGSLLRNALLPAPNVSYLERYMPVCFDKIKIL
jgi:hypothetical protein